MHRIQQHILQQLILHPCVNYARLKPNEVEGNLFTYHLRQLIQAELVIKNPTGLYELSPSGQTYADQFSLKTLTPRVQARIVTLLAIQNIHGQWLLYRRLRQPLINMVGFPYGKLHIGETIARAAERELKEKTGLTANLMHRADGYITIFQQNQITSHIMFHLFYGQNPKGKLLGQSKVGQAFWGDVSDIGQSELIPSVPNLIQMLNQNNSNHFFVELEYHINKDIV